MALDDVAPRPVLAGPPSLPLPSADTWAHLRRRRRRSGGSWRRGDSRRRRSRRGVARIWNVGCGRGDRRPVGCGRGDRRPFAAMEALRVSVGAIAKSARISPRLLLYDAQLDGASLVEDVATALADGPVMPPCPREALAWTRRQECIPLGLVLRNGGGGDGEGEKAQDRDKEDGAKHCGLLAGGRFLVVKLWLMLGVDGDVRWEGPIRGV